jgi:DNA-binding transcriptional ArsR family regulator
MGQAEVLEALKEKEWMTTKEISAIVGTRENTVTQNLSRLREQGLVESQRIRKDWYWTFIHRLVDECHHDKVEG